MEATSSRGDIFICCLLKVRRKSFLPLIEAALEAAQIFPHVFAGLAEIIHQRQDIPQDLREPAKLRKASGACFSLAGVLVGSHEVRENRKGDVVLSSQH